MDNQETGPKSDEKPNEPPEHIMQFFDYQHLPEGLQEISRPFAVLAHGMKNRLPRNPERTTMLRKLLEAKDCAVRASLGRE